MNWYLKNEKIPEIPYERDESCPKNNFYHHTFRKNPSNQPVENIVFLFHQNDTNKIDNVYLYDILEN